MVKEFETKDFIYNNGIVNLYRFLEENDFNYITYFLTPNKLKLDYQDDKIYFEILKTFFKKYKIIYQTKNDRYYFDENKMDFILDKKFDSVGGQSNDLRNGVYLYKNISEFGMSREEVEKLYLEFCQKYNLKPEMENGKLKVPNKKNELIIAITLDEAIERFTNYFVKDDNLKLDSKIHTFEDGQNNFHNLLKIPKKYKIDKWDALIYWFGGRVDRYYEREYFIYLNSSNLQALLKLKEFLKIQNSNITFRDNNKNRVIATNSNIDFYETLKRDEIKNRYFYISKSAEEFELKVFIYLYSLIFHIEEQYKKANIRRKLTRKELYESLQLITFVIFTDDGTFKTSFDEYTKIYKLFQFFDILKSENIFDYLATLISVISLSKKEVNNNSKKLALNILNFSNIRKELYLSSFDILKNNSSPYSKRLFEFQQVYLKNILGGKEMDIHKKAKIVGDGIGYFCAELNDKDLLFKLRSIKNYKQLLAYFKDLKFAILKNENKARFSKDFNESLEEILKNLQNEWEVIRDYVAIYAIDKYRATNYAKKGE